MIYCAVRAARPCNQSHRGTFHGKGSTACAFRLSTKAAQDNLAKGGEGWRSLQLHGMTAVDGAHPIVTDGKTVGASAVSGVTSEQDGQIGLEDWGVRRKRWNGQFAPQAFFRRPRQRANGVLSSGKEGIASPRSYGQAFACSPIIRRPPFPYLSPTERRRHATPRARPTASQA
jgi:hypothetical protein